nr:hypothetical protein Itr_chr07CG09840 [Ipomoea trifida]
MAADHQSREFVLRRQIASKKDSGSSTLLLLEFLIGLPNPSTSLVCRSFPTEVVGDHGALMSLLLPVSESKVADELEAHHSMEQPPKRETFALVQGAAGAWVSIGVDKSRKRN